MIVIKRIAVISIIVDDGEKTGEVNSLLHEYAKIIASHDQRGRAAMGSYERFEFYEQAKKCYAVVATGESAIYANIIIKKGVVK